MDHSPQKNVATFLTSAPGSSCPEGLNMSQPPAHVRATSQGLGSGDKSKQLKIAVRSNEVVASKSVQPRPHSPHLSTNFHAGQVGSDSTNTSHTGKFLVFKPGRENGVTVVSKDASISTSDVNCRVLNDQLALAPSTPTASRGLNNWIVSALENKVAALSLSSRPTMDKRSSQSLAQSRSEFSNLMRGKATSNATTILSDPSLAISSPGAQTLVEIFKEGHASVTPPVLENGSQMEGHAEEEINAFCQEYMNRRPSLELCKSSQPNCTAPTEFHPAISCIADSESSSSESEA